MKRNGLILVVLFVFSACFVQIGFEEYALAAEGSKPEETAAEPVSDSVNSVTVPASSKGEPVIKFEKVIHDLGNIEPGSNNICEFKFKNTGDGLLRITEVSKTCGCTPFTLEKEEYKPGESGVLKVEYHAGKFPDSIQKTLSVSSNDKVNPRIELTLKGNIVTIVEYKPRKLSLVLNKENADCPAITVRSLDGKVFSITKVEVIGRSGPGKDFITVDFDSSAKATKFVLQPKIDVEKLREEVSGRILITVDHPRSGVIEIPFEVLPRFKVTPPSIIIYKAELDKSETREVWILSNYNEEFEIESTSSLEGTVKVMSREKIDNRYKLVLEITPPAADKGKRGFFTDTFSVGIKGGEELKIPCRMFYVRKTEKAPPAAEKPPASK